MQRRVNFTRNFRSVNTLARDVLLLLVLSIPYLFTFVSLLLLEILTLLNLMQLSLRLWSPPNLIFRCPAAGDFCKISPYFYHFNVYACEILAVCCIISSGTHLLSWEARNTPRYQAREPVNWCTGDN